MHYCSVCKKLMNDKFEEITAINKYGAKVLRRWELTNPICDECLSRGWKLSEDKMWVMCPVKVTCESPVSLSDYIMDGDDDK